MEAELHMKQIKSGKEARGDDLTKDEKDLDMNLNKRKSIWMDRLCQKMADIIFFLEFTSKPDLQPEFQEEVEDLLGFSYNPQYPTAYFADESSIPWYKLLSSALIENSSDSEDPRMIGLAICQNIIKKKMKNVTENEYYETYAHEIVERINQDFGMAFGWICFTDRTTATRRPIRRMIIPPYSLLADSENVLMRSIYS